MAGYPLEEALRVDRLLEKLWGIDAWLPKGPRGVARVPRPWGFLVAEPRPLAWRGEWILYYVRKVGLSTVAAARMLAGALGARSYGFYGLKDTDAVAFQHIGLLGPSRAPRRVELAGGRLVGWLVGVRVSRPQPGLHGWNSFRVVLEPLAGGLECGGLEWFPNYFGPQRFGVCRPNSHLLGLYIARGDWKALERELRERYPLEAGPPRPRLGRFERRIALEALQAYIWNRALSIAVADGLVEEAGPPWATLSCPLVAGRIRAPAASLPSPRRRGPGWWEELVDHVLGELGLPRGSLRGLEPRMRPLLSRPCTGSCKRRDERLWYVFTLPRGCYATVFLRQLHVIDWAWDCARRYIEGAGSRI